MKNITRALALLLALILILGLVVTGFADAAVTTGPGKITINKAVAGQTYTIYKILELESYNAETGKEAYSYKAASGWENFFKTGDGSTYFDVTADGNADNVEAGYVTWKSIAGETEVAKQARVAEFAKKALAYAKNTSNNISATRTQANVTEETITFDSLPLGYYLLDSSLGTLCSLSTTKPEATITEKNAVPENKKLVQEDSKVGKADEYGAKNDADIGQTVNFKSTITAQAGAQNYVFHDTMSEGLTFDTNSVVIKKGNDTLTANTDYEVKTSSSCTPACTFDIEFKQTFCDKLTKGEEIVITYSATLNENAHIGTDTENEKNFNKSKLSYGDSSETQWSQTTTNTWEVKVFKYYQKDATQQGLAGATFTLKRNNETDAIKLMKVGNTASTTYRVAKTGETAITEITTDTTGRFTIQGLDSDTYYLTEKEAPKGYNKLKDPIKIVIDENGNVKVNNATTPVTEVGVENKTGAEMPSTGGIGTTVFYVVGGILAIGAAVLLVTKKRMERG